jgi:O-antigen/teichoic acid export membrane protein
MSAGLTARLLGVFGTAARAGTLGLADQVVVSGTNFLTFVAVGRVAGAEQLGIYSLGFTIMVLISCVHESLIAAPYTVYGNRVEGEARAQLAGSVLVQHCLLTGAAMIALAVAAAAFSAGIGPPRLGIVMWTLVATMPFVLLRDFCRRFAFAHLRMAIALLLDVSVAMLQIATLLWLAVHGELSAVTAHGAVGLACVAPAVVSVALARASFVLRRERMVRDIRHGWSFGKWVFAAQMTGVIDGYLVHWLLAFVLDPAATGKFAACMTVVMLSNPLLIGIGNVLAPGTARAFVGGGIPEVRRVVWRVTLFLGTVMTAFVGLVVLFGGGALRVFFGPEYAGDELSLAVLSVAMLACALGRASDSALRAVGKPQASFLASVLSLAANLTAAAALMGSFGVLGAAWGMLAGGITGSVARGTTFGRVGRDARYAVGEA